MNWYRPWIIYGSWFSTRLITKTWFFTFLNVYVPWIKRAKTLTSRLSTPKFRYFCLVSFFLFSVMLLKIPKIAHFLQIFADPSKKSKIIKTIYSYLSERPHHSKNSNFIDVSPTVHVEMMRNTISKKCWISRNSTKFTIFKR